MTIQVNGAELFGKYVKYLGIVTEFQ